MLIREEKDVMGNGWIFMGYVMCMVRYFWYWLVCCLFISPAFARFELQASAGKFFEETPNAAKYGAYRGGGDFCTSAKPFVHEVYKGRRDETWVQFSDNYVTVAYAERLKNKDLIGSTHRFVEAKTYKFNVSNADFQKYIKPVIEKVIDNGGGCGEGSKFDDFMKMFTSDEAPEHQSFEMGDGTKMEGYFFGNDKTSCFISTNSSYGSSCFSSSSVDENGHMTMSVGGDIDIADYLSASRSNSSSSGGSLAGSSGKPPKRISGSTEPKSPDRETSSGTGAEKTEPYSTNNGNSEGSHSGTVISSGKGEGKGEGEGDGEGDCKKEGEEDCKDKGPSWLPTLEDIDLIKVFGDFKKSQEERFDNFAVELSSGGCSPITISADFKIFSVNQTIDLHCDIFKRAAALLTGVFMFLWSVISIRIVLSA